MVNRQKCEVDRVENMWRRVGLDSRHKGTSHGRGSIRKNRAEWEGLGELESGLHLTSFIYGSGETMSLQKKANCPK